jgi:hypothetical protein
MRDKIVELLKICNEEEAKLQNYLLSEFKESIQKKEKLTERYLRKMI